MSLIDFARDAIAISFGLVVAGVIVALAFRVTRLEGWVVDCDGPEIQQLRRRVRQLEQDANLRERNRLYASTEAMGN